MAPVAIEPELRYTPLAVVIAHLAAVTYLISTVGRGLYKSYKELGPSQDTRFRTSKRQKIIPVFAGLALLGLSIAGLYSLRYATLSYKVWVEGRGLAIPKSLYATTTHAVDGTRNHSVWYINKWLSDTPIYFDAAEIVAEKARRFWWGNQQELSTLSWNLLLAIEGRRRKIPYLWAYALLGQLVNLSFAQNLFYVALLLTPAPLDGNSPRLNSRLSRLFSRVFTAKPDNWCPNPIMYLGILALHVGAVFLLPSAAGTSSFRGALALAKVLSFAPLFLPTIIPETWGTVHAHPHDAYGAYASLFRFISLASLALHAKSSIAGFTYNLPGSYKHRHSIHIPFDTEKRSSWERSTTAAGKVLGSLSDHPVVAAVGYDVLLSAFSLGLWAALRAIDVESLLQSSIPFYKGAPTIEAAGNLITAASDAITGTVEAPGSPASLKRRGRPAKAKAAVDNTIDASVTTTAGTKRGRPRKVKVEEADADIDTSRDGDDATYTPTAKVAEQVAAAEGDRVLAEDDWEAASLAWGLTALGGLGVGSAAVYGAECISR